MIMDIMVGYGLPSTKKTLVQKAFVKNLYRKQTAEGLGVQILEVNFFFKQYQVKYFQDQSKISEL